LHENLLCTADFCFTNLLSGMYLYFYSEGHIGLERKVTKLEALVKMLQEDLKKIKRLWEDNQRLQEESQTSAAKLKKFTEWVFNTIDMN
ncbi:hypothetical protein GOODEAATRI_006678, partial [Goodea atripinnis]